MNDSFDLGFDFRERGNGTVEITRHGRLVTTLAGESAERFRHRVQSLDAKGRQRAMARATGQYKFGNERTARNRRR